MTDKPKVINVKLDADTKSKFETLAYLQDVTLQELCIKLINTAIVDNADAIAKAEELRKNFKK